ncbi:hypothetical protein HMPREF9336_04244 [Segniliparus rugosus ATCC BAA-974]|uniref:Uncharacterized protein n=1 Tax=Segniliparus rugosus (strain ATCC BAA-974 / DSM 45345 / CCUG 50838 / CIP 108380 / JCM 13579 / CDC 945) TaxID=679197 RepID=U1M1X8_SEGRC|nr:hypothetical protein HMPREF9336_04244 [Segniliparus rugosus ATCC BAA-974]
MGVLFSEYSQFKPGKGERTEGLEKVQNFLSDREPTRQWVRLSKQNARKRGRRPIGAAISIKTLVSNETWSSEGERSLERDLC